jgi:hypothetical protein
MITEYSGEGLDIPRHERGDKVLQRRECPEGSSMTQESKTSEQVSEMIISAMGYRGCARRTV